MHGWLQGSAPIRGVHLELGGLRVAIEGDRPTVYAKKVRTHRPQPVVGKVGMTLVHHHVEVAGGPHDDPLLDSHRVVGELHAVRVDDLLTYAAGDNRHEGRLLGSLSPLSAGGGFADYPLTRPGWPTASRRPLSADLKARRSNPGDYRSVGNAVSCGYFRGGHAVAVIGDCCDTYREGNRPAHGFHSCR